MADLKSLGLLESSESAQRIGGGEADINLVAGLAFGASDSARVLYGTTSALGSATSPVSLSGKHPESDPAMIPLTGIPADTRIHYQVELTVGGVVHLGEARFFDHDPDATRTVIFHKVADGHCGAQRLSNVNIPLLTMRRGHRNIADFIKASPHPNVIDDIGDHSVWALANANSFPVDPDFTKTTPSTSRWSLSQSDSDRLQRAFRIDAEDMLAYAQILRAPGNHDCHWHWMYAANNGGAISAADYALAAFQKYHGNIGDSPAWHGDPKGRWGYMDIGPVRKCYVDVGLFTQLTSTDPATGPYQPDDRDHWTLSQECWDFFFHATTGCVTLANPAVTPFVEMNMHNGLGGQSDGGFFANYAWGGAHNMADKTDINLKGVHEMGPGAVWLNPHGYSGDHLALGFAGAFVNRTTANGCQGIIFVGHVHLAGLQFFPGCPVFILPRFCNDGSNQYGWGFREEGGFWDGAAWLDTQANSRFMHNPGYFRCAASPTTYSVHYIRTTVPESLFTPPDGLSVNGTAIHICTLTLPTKARCLVRDTGDRWVEDSTTPAASGSTQPDPDPKEPLHAITMFGACWQSFTAGANNEHIAVRSSTIDAARVLSTKRPKTAGATAIRETICTPLFGLNREIRVKVRMESNAPTAVPAIIGICAQPENWATTGSGKGLTLRVSGVSIVGTSMTLRFDSGADGSLGTASPDYKCPEGAAFDLGLRIVMKGRRIIVWADNGSGVMTKRLDVTLSTTNFGIIKADPTMRCVGLNSFTNNITAQGRITEWRDFYARSLS